MRFYRYTLLSECVSIYKRFCLYKSFEHLKRSTVELQPAVGLAGFEPAISTVKGCKLHLYEYRQFADSGAPFRLSRKDYALSQKLPLVQVIGAGYDKCSTTELRILIGPGRSRTCDQLFQI